MAELTSLIDKQDSFEIVRDQLAAILATETAAQQALATAGGEDPLLWKLRVYSERSNPWEQFLNGPADKSPLVNVWYDNSNFIEAGSSVSERQKTAGTFNIDCYGYGEAADVVGGGHNPGDREAALIVQRALRLVRNIFMAAPYTYLGLRGLVWQRWIKSITVFQPGMDNRSVQQIVGARVSMGVTFNELAPQVEADTLEYVAIDILRAEDGEIVAEADFDYTA